MIRFKCPTCKKKVDVEIGKYNRAKKMGLNLYCGRICAGIGRRKNRTIEEKKTLKAIYDAEYRLKNQAMLKKKKHEYFKRTYDPKQAAIERKKRMHIHIEYCRRPEYKKYKQQYDQKYRAKKMFGAFWESFLLIKEIEKLYNQREVRRINNLENKTQKRKKKWRQQLKNKSYLQVH